MSCFTSGISSFAFLFRCVHREHGDAGVKLDDGNYTRQRMVEGIEVFIYALMISTFELAN